jgi:hypothetical protein
VKRATVVAGTIRSISDGAAVAISLIDAARSSTVSSACLYVELVQSTNDYQVVVVVVYIYGIR